MVELVSQSAWNAQHTQLKVTDKITVRNLEVIVNAGVDVWGRETKQRSFITITLSLAQSFDTAAEADTLDKSTVHYGKLSKDIRSLLESNNTAWVSSTELAESIRGSVLRTAGSTVLQSVEVDILYPKGSMLGDGAGLSYSYSGIDSPVISRVLYLRNVKIPCLIGVNANERTQKQPVVVNVGIECLPEDFGDQWPRLESIIVDAISDSSFETLESLSTMVVQVLRQKIFTREQDKQAHIRLRVEKPLAVPFADAPVIEVYRPVPT